MGLCPAEKGRSTPHVSRVEAGPPDIGAPTCWSHKFNGGEKEGLSGRLSYQQLSARNKPFFLGLPTVLKPTHAEGSREPDSSLVKREPSSLRLWGGKGIYTPGRPGAPESPEPGTPGTAWLAHSPDRHSLSLWVCGSSPKFSGKGGVSHPQAGPPKAAEGPLCQSCLGCWACAQACPGFRELWVQWGGEASPQILL